MIVIGLLVCVLLSLYVCGSEIGRGSIRLIGVVVFGLFARLLHSRMQCLGIGLFLLQTMGMQVIRVRCWCGVCGLKNERLGVQGNGKRMNY